MHKAGGREAAAIRIVPVGRVELSAGYTHTRINGEQEREGWRERG